MKDNSKIKTAFKSSSKDNGSCGYKKYGLQIEEIDIN